MNSEVEWGVGKNGEATFSGSIYKSLRSGITRKDILPNSSTNDRQVKEFGMILIFFYVFSLIFQISYDDSYSWKCFKLAVVLGTINMVSSNGGNGAALLGATPRPLSRTWCHNSERSSQQCDWFGDRIREEKLVRESPDRKLSGEPRPWVSSSNRPLEDLHEGQKLPGADASATETRAQLDTRFRYWREF